MSVHMSVCPSVHPYHHASPNNFGMAKAITISLHECDVYKNRIWLFKFYDHRSKSQVTGAIFFNFTLLTLTPVSLN